MDFKEWTRRDFLRLAGLTGAGLVAGTVVPGCAPGAALTPAPAATKPKEERVLRVANAEFWGETLDPTVETVGAFLNLTLMYDTAFEKDPANGSNIPGIVTKWELAPDQLSWTFTLRNDVVWHDGSKLTAEDLKFSYQFVSRNEPNVTYGPKWRALLGNTPKIDIVDQYTLRVFTNGPQPDFFMSSGLENPYLLLFPKAYIEKNGIDYFRKNPIGSGPYKFVRYVPGDLLEFKAVGYKHWRESPDFDRVIMYLVPEEATRIAMLETGAADEIPVSLEAAVPLKAKGFNVIQGEPTCTTVYCMGAYHDLAKGLPLADVRVRQALSLAVNRQEIIDTMFHGLGSMPAPPKFAWDRPDVGAAVIAKWKAWAANAYRYDPTEAKRLLEAAGFSKGFSFDLWSAPDFAAAYLGDLLITCASYWERIGAHANIVNVDKTLLAQHRLTSKSTQLVGKMTGEASPTRRPGTIQPYSDFTSKYGSKDYLVHSPDITEYDTLWKEGAGSFDRVRLEKIVDRLTEITTSSWVGIPIVAAPQVYATGPRVQTVFSPFGQPPSFFAKWKYTGVEKLPGK